MGWKLHKYHSIHLLTYRHRARSTPKTPHFKIKKNLKKKLWNDEECKTTSTHCSKLLSALNEGERRSKLFFPSPPEKRFVALAPVATVKR